MSGSVGPIVITEHGAQGLDSSTGATTWSYSRQAHTIHLTDYLDPTCDKDQQAQCYAALSPDRTHLVIVYSGGVGGDLFVALDTATGEATFEHRAIDWRKQGIPIQITDHVIAVGTELISLADGSVVAELPGHDTASRLGDTPEPTYAHTSNSEASRIHSPFLQGGHSTLILGSSCTAIGFDADHATWCEITIAPDNNPTATMTVDGVVPIFEDREYAGLTVVDGWTVRYSDPEATYEDLEARFNLDSLGYSIDAVNLDTLSSSVTDVQSVTLGDLDRPVLPGNAYTLGIRDPDTYSYTYQRPTLSVVFDPVTGQVQSAAELTEHAAGVGYLDTLIVEGTEDLALNVLDLNDDVVLRLDSDDIATPEYTFSAEDTLYVRGGYLASAPGIVALTYERSTVDADKHSTGREFVVCGLG
ncbi:hypothetical protein BW737_007995 [Actinomyces ruminis]|uniref:PQQ-like domain-containing protein n=1 Tax=Actinomyces ruminis TaxID=1937003 RepID=A0ABX4MCA1_9ACTO|nr:hypothetical protein BW737_007995 [Actinomyces ruminis]